MVWFRTWVCGGAFVPSARLVVLAHPRQLRGELGLGGRDTRAALAHRLRAGAPRRAGDDGRGRRASELFCCASITLVLRSVVRSLHR
eukprot:scaffold266429_cov27-Tisochrysis_lutea.AAC.1